MAQYLYLVKYLLTLLRIYDRMDNETSDIQLVEIPNNKEFGNDSFLIPYDGKDSVVYYTFLVANKSKLFHFQVLLLHDERGICRSRLMKSTLLLSDIFIYILVNLTITTIHQFRWLLERKRGMQTYLGTRRIVEEVAIVIFRWTFHFVIM
jgi:hypothetical protein